jgi:hypothetical protein
MSEAINIMIAAGILLSGIGAVFLGLARLRMADAWRIWARRCDPNNPNFRPPFFFRRP